MVNSYIKAISYYLPTKVLSNDDLVKDFPEWDANKVSAKLGVAQRHIVDTNETACDLAFGAATALFEEYNIDKKSIDFLLLCTQSPDYFLPSTSCILQKKLGLNTNIGAFDFNLGCSGFVYGLSIAKGLIAANIATNILLITAETYTKHIHPKDKGNRSIFGDAAAATLVSTSGFAQIGNFCLGTDGDGAKNLIVETGAMRNPTPKNDLIIGDKGSLKTSDYLFMNGPEIMSFTLSTIPQLVANTIAKNNLSQKNIDLFVFHQANEYILRVLQKSLNIDDDKFFLYMKNVGNTVSSTIPIALVEARKQNKLHKNILIAGFGVGYSWGGTVLSVVD